MENFKLNLLKGYTLLSMMQKQGIDISLYVLTIYEDTVKLQGHYKPKEIDKILKLKFKKPIIEEQTGYIILKRNNIEITLTD